MGEGQRQGPHLHEQDLVRTDALCAVDLAGFFLMTSQGVPKRKKERKRRTQGRVSLEPCKRKNKERKRTPSARTTHGRDADGRTARRHHTGILRFKFFFSKFFLRKPSPAPHLKRKKENRQPKGVFFRCLLPVTKSERNQTLKREDTISNSEVHLSKIGPALKI